MYRRWGSTANTRGGAGRMKHTAMTDFREAQAVSQRDVTVETPDGRALAGTVFEPARPIAVMLVNAATGLTQDFYHPFARNAASHGWAVLTYDMRGCGGSRAGPARDDPATLFERGAIDGPAAARWLCERHRGLPLDVIGHSSGGHFLPLLPNDPKPRKVALLASSDGYWGRHALSVRFKIWAFWNIVGRLDMAMRGHVARGNGVWKGEDLPPGVWRQWRAWGRKRDYFTDFLRGQGLLDRYRRFARPIRAWTADDDRLATPDGVRWLLNFHPSAPSEMTMVRAADLGGGRIGHQGLFDASMRDVFWPQVFRWLSRP